MASNYTISSGQTTTANITAKSLTVSGITASDKTYDATTAATLGTGAVVYGGLVSGDTLTGTYSGVFNNANVCLLYTSPSPRDATLSRMPSSA